MTFQPVNSFHGLLLPRLSESNFHNLWTVLYWRRLCGLTNSSLSTETDVHGAQKVL